MANIRKTFNFRNGVQVDEDNFIVDSLGKVGIGTTVPTQMLDVRGDAKVVGILTSQSLEVRNVNVSGVTTFSGNTHVGAAITMYPSAGIISATQIHGDGRNLINIPTSQWTDINAGLGFTSIYNSGFVGVSTNDPRFTLQIGGNNDLTTFANGVGINSSGGIVATGVITATNFKGDVQGDSIVGNLVGNVNSSGLSTVGTVRFDAGHVYNALSIGSTYLNVTGLSTFTAAVSFISTINANDDITIATNKKINVGGLNNLQISHANDVSLIRDTRAGVGATLAIGADKLFLRNKDGNENYLEATDNGSVKIYHDFSPKFQTSGLGATVYGTLDATQINVTGVSTLTGHVSLGGTLTGQIKIPDNKTFKIGAGLTATYIPGATAEVAVHQESNAVSYTHLTLPTKA